MTFKEYVRFVKTATWPGKIDWPLESAYKLTEEANEALSVARHYDGSLDMKEELRLELGDTLNLVINTAKLFDIDIWSVIEGNQEKLVNREKYGKGGHGRRS